MNSKIFNRLKAAAPLLPLLLLLPGCAGEKRPGETDAVPVRPNILLLVADDQGYADISATGLAADVHTPNIDRIAEGGIRFTQAYATSPICNASRAGLMTGCYQQRFGTYWYGGQGIHDQHFRTIAEVLKDSGYATGYVGRFHYGDPSLQVPGNRNFPLDHGYDFLFGCGTPRKHYLVHNSGAEAEFQKNRQRHNRQGQSLQQGPMWLNDKQIDVEGMSTEVFAAQASQFIMSHLREPFFLTISFNAVHNFTHQLPPEYLAENGLQGYHDWDPAREDYYEWYRQGRFPNNPEGRALYLGQLYYLDREIGKVLDLLTQQSLRENTIVIYLSDNGGSTPIYADNSPLKGSKYTLYEGGVRVPLLISWPGHLEEGLVLDNIVSAMDVLPTICGLAGLQTPEGIDGIDLTGLLDGSTPELEHDFLAWDTGLETAVRQGDWKLRTATSREHADYEMVELELGEFLYNLVEDPGETTNLAAGNPEMLDRLKSAYREWSGNNIPD